MEPQQGGEQLAWGPTGAGAACLCPAAVASSAAGNVFPRQVLEQEMLRRAEQQLQLQVGGGGGGDRRRERKMKNRESAARSRLRRMAYVSELEKEVSLLRAEKEELAKLCQELKEAAADEAPASAPGKRAAAAPRRLQRTASAPF
ncbi:protein FD-like [Panicum virgatum]|uniref:BZIP domain-containing protein n=1 Tax=Panicum virgatum TaxID=38727 RepID=A0A8T0RKE6_PANVG|nr:protein FD-like [Panicum virgatum]XP_039855687.1 protein FD-like [Panicum virgatum]XP_039855688.1 protein FD-like [Panicum virgatum]XP_039855689.1 protein FD-like [Panicum virgatum]KAG2585605.1 hypothetical protein PVAP13_6KG401600 [Panicum virgatum]KAG2585606.1 hypothetical protein PVAP13_6KG401600 [Panicum virgatum]KAG2585607.1 hypothetical protein PVAP13_6KG401600 [Panicum virgatum]KAG2585608.1 hypothetical protein PVAP13_6KG401600 [Panicum virgatum]